MLIEIKRIDDLGNGCGEDGIILPPDDLNERNNCRNIHIRLATDGCSFDPNQYIINFIKDDTNKTTTLKMEANPLTTGKEKRSSDIALFPEMLHWFHFLRNPIRFVDYSKNDSNAFKYAGRAYYGEISELCIWEANVDSEEIATILGSPNYYHNNYNKLIHPDAFLKYNLGMNTSTITINKQTMFIPNSDKFLNGDDLSENAYRISRGQNMRFGHNSKTIRSIPKDFIPHRFSLAYKVAITCYNEIKRLHF